MAKAIKNSLLELKAYIKSTPSRVQKLISGSGTPGTRAAPAQTGRNDSNIGSRIDFGDPYQKGGKTYQRLKFQLNKNAANSQIKKLVQQNGSHKVWAEADVEIKQNLDIETAKQIVDDVFGEMEKKL